MKRYFIAAALAAISAGAFAADTATVVVNAKVSGTCLFQNKSGTLDFGTLDPSAGSLPATAAPTQGLIINCTKGTLLGSIVLKPTTGSTGTATTGTGLSGGSYSGTMKSGTDTLPFTITWPATSVTGTGFPGGSTPNLTLTGGLALADVQAAVAGTYSSSVDVVITP